MSELTSRLTLPLLVAGQAQKEITHNEALTRIDGLLHGVLESHSLSVPPADPNVGQLWLVGSAPTLAWAGQSGRLAHFTGGGWRFTTPTAGHILWSKSDQFFGWFDGTAWRWGDWPVASLKIGGQQVIGGAKPPIANPSGGSTVDSQARSTLSAILELLRDHGLLLT
jgi:hypothetical protein